MLNAFTVDVEVPFGTLATPTGTPAQKGSLTITPAGTLAAGNNWSLILNGRIFSFAAEGGDTINDVVAGLAGDINSVQVSLIGDAINQLAAMGFDQLCLQCLGVHLVLIKKVWSSIVAGRGFRSNSTPTPLRGNQIGVFNLDRGIRSADG